MPKSEYVSTWLLASAVGGLPQAALLGEAASLWVTDRLYANTPCSPDGALGTIIIATGVPDFMADLEEIDTVTHEANRIVSGTGNVSITCYRFRAAQKRYPTSLGLLRDSTLRVRSALALHRLGVGALVRWVAKMAGISTFQAVRVCISTGLQSMKRERAMALVMRRVLAQAGDPDAFIEAVPETQAYREESAIGHLLDSLSMQIEDCQVPSCYCQVRVSRPEA